MDWDFNLKLVPQLFIKYNKMRCNFRYRINKILQIEKFTYIKLMICKNFHTKKQASLIMSINNMHCGR